MLGFMRGVVVLGCCASASADVLNWINAAGGSAATSTNWNPQQVPDQSDTLVWNINGTYTVTFPLAVNKSATQTYRRGVVTLDVTSPHTILTNVAEPGLIVGNIAGTPATMRQISGRITCADPVDLGNLGSGTLIVDGGSTEFIVSSTTALVSVGHGGTGRLEVSNGALFDAAGDLVVANGNGTIGDVVVGPLADVIDRATLRVDDDLQVGFSGPGTLRIFDGGLVDVGDQLTIGSNATGTGTVTIEGAAHRSSSLLVGSSLTVGNAGSGELNIASLGGVIVDGLLSIGDEGGSGVVNLDGGTIQASQILVGGNGALNARGTINDPVENDGVVNATNTLTFNGPVANDGLMSGQPMVFNDSLTTTQDVAAPATFGAGVPCIINDGCLIGSLTSANGVAGDARFLLNGHTAILYDADGVEIGSVDGEGFMVTGEVDLQIAGSVSGDVTLNSPVTYGMSRVVPGSPSSQDPGAIEFVGHAELNAGTIVELDIGSTESDSINADTIELGGAHLQVRALPGYVPTPGDSFTLISAGSITGPFTVDVLPPNFRVSRFASEIRVSYGCAADIDGNGLLNIFDFLAFQTAFALGDEVGDFDGNGAFNIFDFLAFQAAFGNGC